VKSAYSGWSYRDNKTSSEAGMMCLKPLVIDLSQPNGEPNEAFEATKAEFVEYARKQDVLFLKGYGVEGRPPPIPHGPDKFNSIQAFWSKTGARADTYQAGEVTFVEHPQMTLLPSTAHRRTLKNSSAWREGVTVLELLNACLEDDRYRGGW